jgi:hypothetical protein
MKRLSVPLAIVASLAIAGSAAATKPALRVFTFRDAAAQVLNPTSVYVNVGPNTTLGTSFVRIVDESAALTGTPLSAVELGFTVKSTTRLEGLALGVTVSRLDGFPSGTDIAVLNASECEGRVSTENPTCEVLILGGGIYTGSVYANWDALAAAFPEATARSATALTADSTEATFVGIDLR